MKKKQFLNRFVKCKKNGKTYQLDNSKNICPCCGEVHIKQEEAEKK